MSLLHGIRVIELGTAITAPLTGVLLADLGADVVKVEHPKGDPFRGLGGIDNPHFEAFNRGKRSVVLDLAQDGAGSTLRRLLVAADVFVDNLRPGALARLGLNSDDLRAANSRLVHCSITGFGTSGPYAGRPAYDGVAQALSGVSSITIDRDDPILSGPTVADNATGMYGCIAILAALARRGESGAGARIELNMLEASLAFIGGHVVAAMRTGRSPERLSRVAASQAHAATCADGRVLVVHLSALEKFWLALLDALGAPELADDPRFATSRLRTENYLALRGELAARFVRESSETWVERLERADVPFAPVHDILEAIDDPHVRMLDCIYRLRDERGELAMGVQPPFLIDGGRTARMRRAPALGEHTAEVLAQLEGVVGGIAG